MIFPDEAYGDWIDWPGGDRPVNPDTYVQVRHRDGGNVTEAHPASGFDAQHGETSGMFASWWVHQNQWWDIVQYRVVK